MHKPEYWLAWVFGAVVMAVVLAVVIPLDRWLTRRGRVDSGWEDWRHAAAGLSRADRWRVWWANATGRAVSEPRLAQLAVRRGEALLRLRPAPAGPSRRYVIGAGVWLVASEVLWVLEHDWLIAALTLPAAAWLFHQATRPGLLERSVAANRPVGERG